MGTVTVTGAGSTLERQFGGEHWQLGHGHAHDCGRRHCHRACCDRGERRCDWNTQHRRGRGQSGGCTRHAHCAELAFGAGTGTINFNHTSADYVFAPAISGNGTVNVLAGTTTLTGANSYSGATNVNAGTLRAGAPNTFSPNSAVTVASGGTLDLNGFSQTVPSVTNAGLVNMGTGTAPGTVLTTISYTGSGGTIAMNTFLGGDGSPSDKLVINGGSATGNSLLRITNAGGPGAETVGEWHRGGAGDQRRHDGGRGLRARWRGARGRLRLRPVPRRSRGSAE